MNKITEFIIKNNIQNFCEESIKTIPIEPIFTKLIMFRPELYYPETHSEIQKLTEKEINEFTNKCDNKQVIPYLVLTINSKTEHADELKDITSLFDFKLTSDLNEIINIKKNTLQLNTKIYNYFYQENNPIIKINKLKLILNKFGFIFFKEYLMNDLKKDYEFDIGKLIFVRDDFKNFENDRVFAEFYFETKRTDNQSKQMLASLATSAKFPEHKKKILTEWFTEFKNKYEI